MNYIHPQARKCLYPHLSGSREILFAPSEGT